MKRIIKLLIAILCLMVICLPLNVYAEDVPADVTTAVADNEVIPEEDAPVAEAPEEILEDKGGFNWQEVKDTIGSKIEVWVIANAEEIGVVLTVISFIIDNRREKKKMKKDMSVMNNNAITIAKEGSAHMTASEEAINNAAYAVLKFESSITDIINKYGETAKAKKILEAEIIELKEFCKVLAESNQEFADEFAELLALANIPNYKKEEMGARHRARSLAIKEAAEHAAHVADELLVKEEVKEDGRKEETTNTGDEA